MSWPVGSLGIFTAHSEEHTITAPVMMNISPGDFSDRAPFTACAAMDAERPIALVHHTENGFFLRRQPRQDGHMPSDVSSTYLRMPTLVVRTWVGKDSVERASRAFHDAATFVLNRHAHTTAIHRCTPKEDRAHVSAGFTRSG
jgi:hypothetical protein